MKLKRRKNLERIVSAAILGMKMSEQFPSKRRSQEIREMLEQSIGWKN